MEIKKSDLNYKADAYGYMIYYKGHPIGGGGVLKKKPLHYKYRRANIRYFGDIAQREIEGILLELKPRYEKEISKIDLPKSMINIFYPNPKRKKKVYLQYKSQEKIVRKIAEKYGFGVFSIMGNIQGTVDIGIDFPTGRESRRDFNRLESELRRTFENINDVYRYNNNPRGTPVQLWRRRRAYYGKFKKAESEMPPEIRGMQVRTPRGRPIGGVQRIEELKTLYNPIGKTKLYEGDYFKYGNREWIIIGKTKGYVDVLEMPFYKKGQYEKAIRIPVNSFERILHGERGLLNNPLAEEYRITTKQDVIDTALDLYSRGMKKELKMLLKEFPQYRGSIEIAVSQFAEQRAYPEYLKYAVNPKGKETLKQAGYKYIRYLGNGQHLLKELGHKKGYKYAYQVFVARKDFAGWGLIYKNTLLEYCGSIKRD